MKESELFLSEKWHLMTKKLIPFVLFQSFLRAVSVMVLSIVQITEIRIECLRIGRSNVNWWDVCFCRRLKFKVAVHTASKMWFCGELFLVLMCETFVVQLKPWNMISLFLRIGYEPSVFHSMRSVHWNSSIYRIKLDMISCRNVYDSLPIPHFNFINCLW